MIQTIDIQNITYSSLITSIMFLGSLIIFVWLSAKSKYNIKSFQFQLSLFIGLYIIGELLEVKEIGIFLSIPEELGSQMHVSAIIFLTVILWIRFYHSKKSVMNLSDKSEDGIN